MFYLWMKFFSFVFRKQKLPNDVSGYNHYSYLEDIYDLVSEVDGRWLDLQHYRMYLSDSLEEHVCFPVCMYVKHLCMYVDMYICIHAMYVYLYV
jgi:hypothetical protein